MKVYVYGRGIINVGELLKRLRFPNRTNISVFKLMPEDESEIVDGERIPTYEFDHWEDLS